MAQEELRRVENIYSKLERRVYQKEDVLCKIGEVAEAIILATLLCMIMIYGGNFITGFSHTLEKVMVNEDTVEIIIIIALMGGMVELIEGAGGALCLYQSDNYVIASVVGCEPMAHVKSKIPYGIWGVILCTIGYILVGFMT